MIDVPVLHHILLTRLILALLEGQADEQHQPYSMQDFGILLIQKNKSSFNLIFFLLIIYNIFLQVNASCFRTE